MGMRPITLKRFRPAGRTARAAFCAGLVLLAGAATAGELVHRVRTWTGPEKTRIVLDLSGPAAYRLERDGAGARVVLPGAAFAQAGAERIDDGRVAALARRDAPDGAVLEIGLADAAGCRHFALPAADGRPARIVVDVRMEAAPPPRPRAAGAPVPARAETLVVMVDAGHGGQDPGAIRGGLREKDVTLDLALRLAALLDAEPGLRAVLTRDDDRTLRLAERVRLAEAARADLFVSLHANTADDAGLRGLMAYFLAPERAADRRERDLEDPRRAADLLGVAGDAAGDPDVLPILMDLRRVSVQDRSRNLAERILAAARRSDTLEARMVRQEEYHVLQSLAMPSALVETAYLTNPDDRALLGSPAGREAIARVLRDGIADYARARRGESPHAGTSWSTWYEVRRGDNLWDLARRHGTSVREILERNHMDSDRLAVGQTLTLP